MKPAVLVERLRDDPEGRYLDQLAAQVPLDDETAAPAVLRDSLTQIVSRHRHRQAARALQRGQVRSPGT